MSSNLCCHLISPKRSVSTLVFLLNFSKSPTPLPSLLMPSNAIITTYHHAILVSSLILRCLSPTTFLQFLNNFSYPSLTFDRRIRNTLDYSTALRTLSPHLSYTQNSITATRFFWTFPSQLNHLQPIVNSSARAVSKSPKFCHITPLLKSLDWLIIEQRIECKVLSITYKLFCLDNLLISTAFSMFNLTAQLAPLTSSLCNVLQFAHVLK